MSMKQQIMEKLFDNKVLTNDEILYIGGHLGDDINNGGTNIPYDHNNKGSLSTACGLTNEDFESVNQLIRTEVMDRKSELNCDSKVVEVYENIAKTKPQHFRLLMYQFVKMKKELQSKSGVGIRVDRGKGGLDDFLDFLRRTGL